jgi:UDP-N-acetylglucosamine transferase subunit ALG13
MIFVTTGTSPCPFQRLVDAASRLAEHDEVVVQHGTAKPPPGVNAFDYAAEAVIAQYVREADVVVCHAGAGSTALALTLGHRPLVLARRADLGENIDDHQVAFAERLARYGLVTLCLDADDIVCQSTSARTTFPPFEAPSAGLITAISAALETAPAMPVGAEREARSADV